MVMYDNEFKTKENNIWIRDKIEPEHNHLHIKSGYISVRLFNRGSNVENSIPVTLSIFSATF